MVWQRLSLVTLSGVGDSMKTSTFVENKFHYYLYNAFNSGQIAAQIQFNSDGSTIYARKSNKNGTAGDTGQGTMPSLVAHVSAGTHPFFGIVYVLNVPGEEKFAIIEQVDQNTAGPGNAPDRGEGVGKWTNASDAIDIVDLSNHGSGDFAADSQFVVFGDGNV